MTAKPKNSPASVVRYTLSAASAAPLTPEQDKRLAAMDEQAIDYSDIADTASMWAQIEVPEPVGKAQITLRLDEDVIAFFKGRGSRYQTRINQVLKSYVRAQADVPAQRA